MSELQLILGGVALVALAGIAIFLLKPKSTAPKTSLDPSKKIAFPLVEKKEISHDTRLFRFGLPSQDHVLGLPVGKHIFVSAQVNGELVSRPYTPTSSDKDKGHFDLVIKVYFKDVHPKFPQGGKMSQYLETLKIGDTVDVRGPMGKITYTGPGTFSVRESGGEVEVKCKRIAMIAGGTGITPMYQVAVEILSNARDTTEVSLLFGNQTEGDILLRTELEALKEKHPNFKVWYTLDRPSEGWAFSQGFVDDKMIQERLPLGSDVVVLLCGPTPMINFACKPALHRLGIPPNRLLVF